MKLKLRHIFFVILTFCSLTPVLAQKKVITEAEVSRIVKTLSADEMQGRMTFTPGIAKASAFIQKEFKKAGLQPLPGSKSFEQAFAMYKVEPISAAIQLAGTAVPAEDIIVSAAFEEINWRNTGATAPEIITIGAAENFGQTASNLMRSSQQNQLVLVNPAHRDIFKRFKNYVTRSGMKTGKSEFATVFILTDKTTLGEYTVSAKNKISEQRLNNVVGYLPGKSKKEEYVVFSSHYDHLGIVKPVNGDSIANGADDDASGTTAVIALSKHFKKQKNNERSLIFVAFTAEEIGGFGSQYFSKQLDPNQVVAMFNIEMIGKVSQFGENAGFITGFDRSDFGKIVQQNLAKTNFRFEPDPYVKENLFYRSDNATLARLGVPAHSLSTDKIDSDALYHSVDDEFDSLNIGNMTQVIRAIAQAATSIISGKDTPTRIALEGRN